MRIVFIHAGKTLYSKLGAHYTQLIKESMHLIPINDYLNGPKNTKKKYRCYESLPQGVIIGVALFDDGVWFNETQFQDPWAHGPYLYPIIDAIRLEEPIQCRGNQLLWKIPKSVQNKLLSMVTIQRKLNDWTNKYDNIMDMDSSILHALTIYQPFAEAIIRKLKTFENRSKRVFKVSVENAYEEMSDNHIYGCRVCVVKRMNQDENKNQDISAISEINYTKYSKPYIKELKLHNHSKLPVVVDNVEKIRYNDLNFEKCHCKRKYFPSYNRKRNGKTKNIDQDNVDDKDVDDGDTHLRRSQRIKNNNKNKSCDAKKSSESQPQRKYNLRSRKKNATKQ